MTYNLALVSSEIPEDDERAWDILENVLNEGGLINLHFVEFRRLMQEQHPHIAFVSGENPKDATQDLDHTVLFKISAYHFIIELTDPRDEDLIPDIINVAHSIDLGVFDLVEHQIHRGDGFHGFMLNVEDEPYLMAPRLDQVKGAVDDMTSSDDSEYLSLQAGNGGGIYVNGEDGIFALQWHETDETRVRQWVAGCLGDSAALEVAVLTDRIRVMVRPNERLSKEDIAFILEAFLHGSQRPDRYAWREVTPDTD